MEILFCQGNKLSLLPTLPNSLFSLYCTNNKLYNLPQLPNSLGTLDCGGNKLSSFPPLPNNLGTLFCGGGNTFPFLPTLPNSLQSLGCGSLNLTSLPVLPSNLKELFCSNNNLTSLPTLPSGLQMLYSNNNPLLSCIPLLPNTLTQMDVNNTSITCLPNKPVGIASNPLPICGAGASCEPHPTASGIVFHDINANGIFNLGTDSLLKGWIVVNSNGWASASAANGEFQIKLDSGVVNTFSLAPLIPYTQSISPANYQVTPISSGSQGSMFNFAITVKPNVQDLRINITAGIARPSFDQWCNASVNNVGTKQMTNVKVKVLKPANFIFANANPAISQQIGDTLIWNNISLSVLQQKEFNINWSVPSTAVLGANYQVQAWVLPTTNDSTPNNNAAVFNDQIRGSYDPNDKKVNITQLDPLTLNQELNYTIRFQNTGTDTAFTVVIRDTLSNNLDMSTFRIVGASHNYSFIVRHHSLLEVFFQNILLPDSFTNEPQSHGFVQYAIKPKSTLQVGDKIENTAFIYFDFNLPVVTNTVVTDMKTTSISGFSTIEANIFPNPNNGKIRISLAQNELSILSISDLTGKILLESSVKNGSEMDLKDLPAGVYVAKITNSSGMKVIKLVRE